MCPGSILQRFIRASRPLHDPVLVDHGHEVGSYAHHQQVEQGHQRLEGDAVALGVGLHELESDSAAGEVVEGVAAVFALGVQHGHGGRQPVFGKMVVADDHVHAPAARIFDLVAGLDAAVQSDYELEVPLGRPVDALERDSVALVVTVGDVEVHPVGETADEGVDQGDRGGAVDVVVAVDQNLLAACYRAVEPFHRGVHVFHQEGVVQPVETRAEEGAGLLEGLHPAFYKQLGEDFVNADLSSQAVHLLGICRLTE